MTTPKPRPASRPSLTIAAEQLADYESATNNLHAAVEDYNTALSWTERLNGYGVRPEVLYNNLALAELGLGATASAASLRPRHSPPTRWIPPS